MTAKRFYFVMLGVVSLLGIGVFASAYFGNSLLQTQSRKLVALKLDSRVSDEQQVSLLQAKKDITKYADLEKEAKVIVPQDKDQAEAVREIVKIASSSGIKLGAINFPSSNLGQSVLPTSPSTPSATKSLAPPVTQVQPVQGIPGVYFMQISIQSDTNAQISYNSLINFLSRLEQNRRTAQVAGVTITPDKLNPNVLSFSLIVNVYIKP